MEPVDVVQVPIPGFSDHGQRPRLLRKPAALYRPRDDRVAHQANRVRVGNRERSFEKTGFFHPGGAGHFAVSVLREPSGVYRIRIGTATRKDRRHTSADRTVAYDQLTLTMNQRGVA